VTADLLRRQLQLRATAEGLAGKRELALLVHGAQTALHRASVVGIDAALRELEPELSDADTIRACRSALQQAADRIVATRPDPADEGTRMAVRGR
jgi:hypothetical protein